MLIDNLRSFTTGILHDMNVSYYSGSKIMRLEYTGEDTAELKRGDTVELNGDLTGGCLTAEGESILIYFIHKLLFEVIQARRTISVYDKKIEDLTVQKDRLYNSFVKVQTAYLDFKTCKQARTRKILEKVKEITRESRQNEIDSLKEKNENLTIGFNGAMEKVRQLEKENENLRIEINTGRQESPSNEFDKLKKAEYMRLGTQFEKERIVLQNQIAALNTQNDNLRESLRKAEESLCKAGKDVNFLSVLVDKLRRKNRVISEENVNLRYDLAQKRAHLKESSYKKDRPKTYITGWAEDAKTKESNEMDVCPDCCLQRLIAFVEKLSKGTVTIN